MIPRTLVAKIWDDHVVAELDDGWDLLHVDRHLVHDVTSPPAFELLAERGLRVAAPELTFGATEHSVSVTPGRSEDSNPLSVRFVPLMRRNCADHGIRLFDIDDDQQGIVHVVGPELGLSLPGTTVVCGDSHTCTNGGVGALGFGIGSTEVAHVLATQTLVQRRSPDMRIVFDGRLAGGVEPKDLILHTIASLGADAGVGHAIEFAGALVADLEIEQRMTVCNLAVELGARIGVIAPDDHTFAWLDGRPHAPSGALLERAVEHWRTLVTDAGASFAREAIVDATDVAPQITWGVSPAHSMAVDGRVPDPADAPDEVVATQWADALEYQGLAPGQSIAGVGVQWVFIGSCTNGRLSDLEAAASVVQGRRVAPGVRALVVPGSRTVQRAAEGLGLDRVFVDAGFEWGEPGCGLCPGLGGLALAPGERCVSTSNRNFRGRQGVGVRTHLAGAATAALAAIEGCIADPRAAARAQGASWNR
ncbi:MAG: 3-isopropylmalate dehydratase large subunit [Acidimicrobiales bacterium]|nr:3-isopropylmalate dehydratase large subunit [Acidimicrobiales bacterium]